MKMAVSHSVFFSIAFLTTSYAAPNQATDEMLKIPPECKGQRFCSIKPDGYEQLEEKINSLLPEFLEGNDFADRIGQENPLKPRKLSPKEDWHNCPYETKTEPLYTYSHENNTKTDIIVQTQLLRQYVDIVTCASEHIDATSSEQCFQELGVSAFGMKASCINSAATRTLYVFDIERNKIIQKPFSVPSCCRCKVSYN